MGTVRHLLVLAALLSTPAVARPAAATPSNAQPAKAPPPAAQQPPRAPAAVKLAAPGLTAAGIPTETAAFYSEYLAQQLAYQGVDVVTAKEIQALVGYERQRQLAACGDEECMLDLGGALGADALLVGDVAKVGSANHFNLKIIDARDGKRLAAFTAKAEGEDVISDTLQQAAQLLAAELKFKLGRSKEGPTGSASAQQVTRGLRPYAWMPAAGGVVALGTGAVFMVLAGQSYQRLVTPGATPIGADELQSLRSSGATYQTVGATALAVGGVALGAAGVMYLLGGGSATVQGGVSVVPGPAGGAIVLHGELP